VRPRTDPADNGADNEFNPGKKKSGMIHAPPALNPDLNSPREIMKNSFTRNHLGMAVACALALGVVASSASAQSAFNDPQSRELIYNKESPQVIKSGFGLCWHSGFGPPPVSTAECDPNYRAPVPVAQAPAPVAAPAPAPVVRAPAPAPVPVAQKIKLDADTLFDFDKAVLRPAGRATLDGFITQLKDINPETIIAVGNTDRFGSNEYNQSLSERRVATVKAYLLDKGVPANKLYTEAKGETNPVTKPGDCLGNKSAKTIACLQPDRRVDVEVIGTKIVR
jgi:OOP family OmpA-OmpF porin